MEPRDMSNIPDGGGFIDTPGTYNVVIEDIKEGTTDNLTEFYVCILKDEQGRTIRDTYFITDKAAWREKLLMDACGLTEEQRKAYVPEMCLGKTIEITVTAQKDNPQYMQVSKVKQTGVTVTPPAPVKEDCPF
ncbi:MAG TPA: hypothetical protein PL124_13040 [Candidatus Cloacimonadota bacterium]|nr:hypothetical protein [Candidatus Cloacimonadota bacterium]